MILNFESVMMNIYCKYIIFDRVNQSST